MDLAVSKGLMRRKAPSLQVMPFLHGGGCRWALSLQSGCKQMVLCLNTCSCRRLLSLSGPNMILQFSFGHKFWCRHSRAWSPVASQPEVPQRSGCQKVAMCSSPKFSHRPSLGHTFSNDMILLNPLCPSPAGKRLLAAWFRRIFRKMLTLLSRSSGFLSKMANSTDLK